MRPRTIGQRALVCLLLPCAALLSMTTVYADESAPNGGGHQNIVQIVNNDNNSLRVDGDIQLNRIPDQTVTPVNEAIAFNENCTGCQTITVALQINLYGYNVTNFQPQNYAFSYNYACTGCFARADAFQCGIQVQDPTHVPAGVEQFIASMRHTLKTIQHDPNATANSAQAEIQGVVNQYDSLLANTLGAPASCQATYNIITL